MQQKTNILKRICTCVLLTMQCNAKEKVPSISLLGDIKPKVQHGQALREEIFQNTFDIGRCM